MHRIAPLLGLLLLALPARGAAATPTVASGSDLPSLLGGESLKGGSIVLATAGFSTLGVAYGQGVTSGDDLGLAGQVDWSTGELLLGGFWRRELGRVEGWDLAGRLGLAWYVDGGSTLLHDTNLQDRGFQAAPGLVLSSRGVGLFSAAFDLPITITTWRGGGSWIAPRLSVGYEAPLYEQVALGIRGALAWRGGTGGAPMRAGQVMPELLVTATWKIF
jgi:hypothetical protein